MNNQLFENSALKALMVDSDVTTADSRHFFNEKDPNLAVLHEKPEHRMMLWMKIRGASNNEIAEASGYTVPWVSQLMRQPWAKAFMAEEMHRSGSDDVAEILKGAAADSVLTLIGLRDDDSAPKAVRRQSAVDLLDRAYGKPVQKVESSADVRMDVTSVAAIDTQLAELERQEKQLTGRG